MSSNFEFRIPSLIEKKLEELDNFFIQFKSDLFLIGLNQKQTDGVVKLMNSLLTQNKNAIKNLLENTATEPQRIVEHVIGRCNQSLVAIDSHCKR